MTEYEEHLDTVITGIGKTDWDRRAERITELMLQAITKEEDNKFLNAVEAIIKED
jgi:hypothetical protein